MNGMLDRAYGILKPDVHETVKGQTFHVRDRRVRQDCRTSGINLRLSWVLLSDSLGRAEGQSPDEREKSLLGEHDDQRSFARYTDGAMRKEIQEQIGRHTRTYSCDVVAFSVGSVGNEI
jgi:hypothetical protein